MKPKQQLTKSITIALLAVTLLTISPALFAQVKIGSNPTVIGATNNLEVEASTIGNKVSVDKTTGKVTIADGSQGVAKVLTSDANGVATWQAPVQTTNLFVDVTTAPLAQQDITASTVNDGYNKLIMANEISDRASNYDPTASEITIPSDGIYLINAGTSKWTTTSGGICISLNLMVNGTQSDILDGGTGCGVPNDGAYHIRGTVTKFLHANDKVYLALRSTSGTPTIGFTGSFIRMVKLSN